MCLPFNWGKQDGHGSGDHQDTPRRQPPRPHPSPDLGNGGYPRQPTVEPSPLDGADHGYGAGENFGAQRRAAGVNVNGEAAGATFYDSHAYGFPDRGPKGFEEKNGALAPAPQTPVVPTPTSGAPWKRGANMEQKERVAAAAAPHHGPVAASQPKKNAMQTAPVPQMARRDKDDDDSADAASSYRRRRY